MVDFRGFFSNTNRLFYVLIASVVLFVFLAVVFILRSLVGGSGQEKVTLKMWGVFEREEDMSAIIRGFEKTSPGIKIEYTKFSFEDYEKRVVDAFASGNGPDIWMINNTWLAKHKDKIQPMPDKFPGKNGPLKTIKDFQSEFVEVAYQDLVSEGKIYSFPVYVDTLAMYYNRDLFNTAGIAKPPVTWEDFNRDVEKLTRFDAAGNITQAGAAIGSSKNINRSTDILASMMIQSGVQMTDNTNTAATFSRQVSNTNVGEIALQYYTDFTNPTKRTYCWNESQHYSIDAFAEGTTAMMFNYSHQIDLLREKSPRLNFGIAPMPQVSTKDIRTYASYWTPVVAESSPHGIAAWTFINYLSSPEGARAYLLTFKKPAARRDIIDSQKSDPDIGVFATQALAAKSWFQIDDRAIETIFAEMIDDVIRGKLTVRDALINAETKINVLMRGR